MKKIISLVMAAALLVSLGTLLIACDEEHAHAFDATWTYDETAHWHVCTGTDCVEAADRADHTFADPVVVTEATADAEGTTKQACSVCGYEKGGKIAFAGVSESKWDAMLSDANFENYTLETTGTVTTTAGGQSFMSTEKSIFKAADDKIEITLFDPSGDSDCVVYDGEIARAQKRQYSQVFLCLLREYEHFTYDAAQKAYTVTKTITISDTFKTIVNDPETGVQMVDMPITIEMRNAKATLSNDGKLLELVCDYTQSMSMQGNDVTLSGLTTWTFSNYGATVINAQ